jgi:hypothetical protein
MIKKLLLLIVPCMALAGTEPINVNTTDGHVKATSSGVGPSPKPFNFSDVHTHGILLKELGDVNITSPADLQVLTYDIGQTKWKNADASAIGASPGGSNTQVQFNDSNAFGGDSGLVWDKTGNALSIVSGTFTDTASDAIQLDTTDVITIGHNSSGTPGTDFGAGILFKLKSDTTNDRTAGRISSGWEVATDATRKSYLQFGAANSSGISGSYMRLFLSGGLTLGGNPTDPGAGVMSSGGAGFMVGGVAPGTGVMLQSNTAAMVYSTAAWPTGHPGSGKVVSGDGTDFVLSTPTFPTTASATSRKLMVSNGTNWVASTETWAVPGTSGNVLTSDGTNWVSSPDTGSTVTPAALTKADDTNVTLTLGGTPATSLLQATSITAGWTGTLAVGRGGTGVGSLGDLTKSDDTNVTLTLGGTPTGALIKSASIAAGWTGTLSQARGGFGKSTASTTDGQIPIGKTSDGSWNVNTITQGTGITVTNGAGTITIAATAQAQTHAVTFTVDGSGAVLSTGTKAYTKIPYGGTLTGWLLIGSPSGSVTIDIFRAADGAGLPVTSIIGGSGTKPALSSAVENSSTSFTSWTSTTLTAKDNMAISLSGISTTTYCSLTLYYQ